MGAQQSWLRAWRGIGAVDDGAAVRDSLLAAYSEPHREYHTLQHLHECLDLLAPAGRQRGRARSRPRSGSTMRSTTSGGPTTRSAAPTGRARRRRRQVSLRPPSRASARSSWRAAHGRSGQRRRAAPGRHRSRHPGRAGAAIRRVRTADPRRVRVGAAGAFRREAGPGPALVPRARADLRDAELSVLGFEAAARDNLTRAVGGG